MTTSRPRGTFRAARPAAALPLLLAALALLAVLFVSAPPTQAQSTDVWTSTLTPKSLDDGLGCDTASSTNANKCSASTTLTDNDFVLDGTTYTITTIRWKSGSTESPAFVSSVAFELDQDVPAALLGGGYKMLIGTEEWRLATHHQDAGSANSFTVHRNGLTFTVDSAVSLKIQTTTPPQDQSELPAVVLSKVGNIPGTVSDSGHVMDLPVTEGGSTFFQVALDKSPGAGVVVAVLPTLSPTRPCGGQNFSCGTTVTSLSVNASDILLTFSGTETDTNVWSNPQTVRIDAAENDREGDEYGVVLMLTSVTTGTATISKEVAGVRVTMHDNDAGGL